MAQHNDTGVWGENLAAEHYVKMGYAIRERNWKYGDLEVDMIAQLDTTIAFVEVKTRRSALDNPMAAVNSKKINNIVAAADIYMRRQAPTMQCRFDVVSIVGTPDNYTLEHHPDAFLRPLFVRRSKTIRRLYQ